MKVFCIICVVTALNFQVAKSTAHVATNQPVVDTLAIKAKKLKRLYLLCTSSQVNVDIYQRQFFDEFPATFSELNDLYGYSSKASILYFDAEKHIARFFNNLNSVNDTLYYQKIIGIAINGRWDADAINYFQHGLKEHVENKPELTVYILQKLSEEKMKSFWLFYFDAPHPSKKIPDSLQRIQAMDNNIYNFMINAHNAALMEKE